MVLEIGMVFWVGMGCKGIGMVGKGMGMVCEVGIV